MARGLRRRDPDLLDALIEQYQHRLLRYLMHLTGNRATAEDLFQETWLRVLEKGHLYDGRNRFVTWLMSIATTSPSITCASECPAAWMKSRIRRRRPV